MQQSTVKSKIDIVQFSKVHQESVEKLVLPIQQIEFAVPITREEQPDLTDIQGTFFCGGGGFWVALSCDEVVGTIGIVDIGNSEVALKKMFVRADFRGKEYGVSAQLMDRVKQHCRENGIERIYLGTTSQMAAAHKFYEKNGFIETDRTKLPSSFPVVHVDTKFYRCELSV